tara:strand:- start:3022 stop:3951 length:930 start_codon:yes stop_codon:yes gene_type:complete
METNLSQKVADFFVCKFCDYKTSKKSDFNKHLLTAKHKNNENGNNGNIKVAKVAKYNSLHVLSCKYCNKFFSSRSGLYKHGLKCNKKNKNLENEIIENQIIENQIIENQNISSSDLVIKLLDDNKEMRKIMIKQQEQLSELIPQIGSNNNNTTNNKLNINVFLNEQCKDALNMNEFIQTMQVSLEQLEYTKIHGLEQGLSKTIMENINKLSLYERPLHCTDAKRETLYIKDNNNWEKDRSKTKIKEVIKSTCNKNYEALKTWKETNPDYMENENKKDSFINIISQIGKSIENIDNKVIKKICKETYVND